jgi:hypothetical protein
MEWIRISVERLFGFLTALIPGAAILLVFTHHYPWLIAHLWDISQLGYESKIAISCFAPFSPDGRLARHSTRFLAR